MSELLGKLIDRVTEFNVKHNIDNPPTMWNISYLGNAITGETGEIANCIKKMLRDGITEKQKQNLFEEIVDNQIYIAMLIEAIGMDFDHHYRLKEAELEKRFADGRPVNAIEQNILGVWE